MNNELENSIQYIKEKTRETPGFSIPENYFDGIEDDFTIKLKEELLPSSTSFNIPDTYFDNLETEILSKVNTTTNKKGKVISLKSRFLKFAPASIAASLLLITSLFFNNNNTSTLEDVSYTDIENWLDENTIYTDTELAFAFEDHLDESELSLNGISFNDDVLEDYLNSIDHSDLLNEIE